jgi:hypothetical protein
VSLLNNIRNWQTHQKHNSASAQYGGVTVSRTEAKKHSSETNTPHERSVAELANSVEHLIEAALSADYSAVRKTGGDAARALETLGFNDSSKRVRAYLRRKGVPLRASGHAESLPVDGRSRLPLVEEIQWPETPLFIDGEAASAFQKFIADVSNADLLSKQGLSSSLCLLLCGPPGTGKSLLAGHLAARLNKPFFVARLDAVISSLLGDTAKNIRGIFDFLPSRDAVLLLDEIDAVAKMRDDKHELGELKRVVNTLIQGLDSLDDRTIVVGATNHPHLLDPAIWRRFPYQINLDFPDIDVRRSMWAYFLFGDSDEQGLAISLAKLSEGLSGADIREIAHASRRGSVLSNTPVDLPSVITAILNLTKDKLSLIGKRQLVSEHRKSLARLLCEDRGISQVDAAKLLAVSRQTIAAYLRGEGDDG